MNVTLYYNTYHVVCVSVCFLSRGAVIFMTYLTEKQLFQEEPVLCLSPSTHCEKSGRYSCSEEGGVAVVITAVSPYITKTLRLTFLIMQE
jgi:hypothetical protein